MSPEELPLDPTVGWAIDRAVREAERRFGETLTRELGEFREQYRTTATCDERHKAEQALEQRVKALEGWVRWALAFSIAQLVGVVLLFVGAILTGNLHL